MRVFIIASQYDTAGQAAKIVDAFQSYAPSWDVRSMRTKRDWLRFPGDMEYDEALAKKFYDEADLVHHQNSLRYYADFDEGQRKPTVLHHHGTRLRTDPKGATREGTSVGATQLVSTADLLEYCPVASWLPAPCNIPYVKRYKKPGGKRVRIGHAPTNRRAKNTEAILRSLNELSRRVDVEIDIIEGVEWTACLSRKGRCDIFIDQLTMGYGNNAIEAMAMGIPVVSGWNDPNHRDLFIQASGVSPQFVEATSVDLTDKLEALVRSRDLRDEYAQRGYDYVEMFHADWRTVRTLQEIWGNTKSSSGEVVLGQLGRKVPA